MAQKSDELMTEQDNTRQENEHQRHVAQALGIVAILQTSLNTETVIHLFARELNRLMGSVGVRFVNLQADIDVSVDFSGRHYCQFQVNFEGHGLGILTVAGDKPFEPAALSLLDSLATALIYPLRNALMYKAAFEASQTDPLTGIRNRLALDEMARHTIAAAHRSRFPVSVLMLDLDYFKGVNDHFGHPAGDKVLRAVASMMGQCIRESDMLARYGGEEFAVVLSGTDLEGAIELAERIRSRMETGLQVRYDGQAIGVTVSLGVAQLQAGEDFAGLLKRADRALYRAKQGGRNLVAADRGAGAKTGSDLAAVDVTRS